MADLPASLRRRPWPAWAVLAIVLPVLALLRPVDHDESQYVAAAVLTGHGLIPYRDFAYLQTPLQPWLLAPLAAAAGALAWPALRVANALLGWLCVFAVWRAAEAAGAGRRAALAAAGLLASCDIMLFAAGTARNDALPAACLALALWAGAHHQRVPRRRLSVAIGLLLGAAAAAKVSYALPAAAFGVVALVDRRSRPGWVALGALPAVALIVASWVVAPASLLFGVWTFPHRAPALYYADAPFRLSLVAKAFDSAKFLALGAALPALWLVARATVRGRRAAWLDAMLAAGILAALLPEPTWRQYWLPALPPLFVRLALLPAPARAVRRVLGGLAAIGLVPSLLAVAGAPGGVPLLVAWRESRAIGAALDAAGRGGPVATLAPELLPAARRLPDPRFATGPFVFRASGLADDATQRRLHLVSADRLDRLARWPDVVMTGGETRAAGGSDALDRRLAGWALAHGYRPLPLRARRLRLFVRPR